VPLITFLESESDNKLIIIIIKAEKITIYKDLIREIQRIWNVEAKVIPVITGATGTISKSLRTIPEQRTRKARN
jgi:hypothetical protein